MNLIKRHIFGKIHHVIYPRPAIKLISKPFSSVVPDTSVVVPRKMNGRAASNEQKRMITEYVSSLGMCDWDAVCKAVLSVPKGYMNKNNINGCILEACSQMKRLDLAKTYIDYVCKGDKNKLSTSLELLFYRTCYACRDQLNNEDRKAIKTRCQLFYDKYATILNGVLLEGIVMGLCCTSSWRDSLDYMKSLKNSYDITGNTYKVLILKAFEAGETDLGWNLMHMCVNRTIAPPIEGFQAWFALCKKKENFNFLRILEFLNETEYIVREELADLIVNNLQVLGCTVTSTKIVQKIGKCTHCEKLLNPIKVTEEEFKLLNECFMSNVIVGNNIFNNSSPQELQDFKDFIKVSAPYDVVVDGLNVAYAYRGKLDNNSLLKIVMKKLIENNLKVLLIGRKHLVRMLGSEFNYIEKNAHLFFTKNLSKDDPFLLYAAMFSGLGTKVLTRDLMREHKYILSNPKIKSIFQRWLQQHRLHLRIRPGNVGIIDPLFYQQITQENGNGIWHLPYQQHKMPGEWAKPESTPDQWLCIKTNVKK